MSKVRYNGGKQMASITWQTLSYSFSEGRFPLLLTSLASTSLTEQVRSMCDINRTVAVLCSYE